MNPLVLVLCLLVPYIAANERLHLPLPDNIENIMLIVGSTIFTMSRVRAVRRDGWQGTSLSLFYTLLVGMALGAIVEI